MVYDELIRNGWIRSGLVRVMGSGATSASRNAREGVWMQYVQRCALEDTRALGKLYDESSSLVYAVALRVLTNEADAEEVTLDVYTQVWRTASGYDPARGSVTAWLITMARSRSIDKLRSRATRAGLEEPLVAASVEFSSGAADPEKHTLISQQRGRILSALQTLTAEQRQALELAYFSGLSHSELASRLGQPLGTVKTRIRLGMMKMRELLEDYA
jgi:RNA polymerase sigma-70 factor (ECF subfamily)